MFPNLFTNILQLIVEIEIFVVKGKNCYPSSTSTILEQELRSWVGKNGVCIGPNLLWVGNTSFHSTAQLSGAYPAY